MKSREVNNPLSRFATQAVEYEPGEGPPPAQITLLEDHSRSILSRNDSPDLGFRWSVNPYRGCLHACSYCLRGDTQILLADGRTRRLDQVVPGDEIYGTRMEGSYRRYTRTRVLDHWQTSKPAFCVTLSNGTQLVASGEHRFLSHRGWKYVTGSAQGTDRRPHLTTSSHLLGLGAVATPPTETLDYQRGYLCGLLRGDATLKRYDYSGHRRRRDVQYQFRLALIDLEALHRSKRYLSAQSVETQEYLFAAQRSGYRAMHAVRTSTRSAFEQITEIIDWPEQPTIDWDTGFLAGIFDAEGSRSQHVLRICNTEPAMIEHTMRALARLGFDAIVEEQVRPDARDMQVVRLRGGLGEHVRFFHTTAPAITRKWDLEGHAVKSKARDIRVVSIEPVGEQTLYDITTGTGDFIANGVISHNCYARPHHEYLDLGAGTDFDTKIVVKPRAAELLRAAFDDKKWQGELVMFSGVTDCYQAIEAQLGLTRACLEVCLEYRNPVSVISKSALVERDAGLLAELAREAGAHVNVSLAWTDAEAARAMEPWAPSPERRLKVIETLAKAGVPVGIMCAPIIPGLNDGQIPKLLERARDAGATWAGWTLLRLPGAVAEVFPERLRAAMPLSAERVLARIRETRGGTGRMNDPKFHTRMRGDGVYAETIAMLFRTTAERLGLRPRTARPDSVIFEDEPETRFRRPAPRTGQLSLFPE